MFPLLENILIFDWAHSEAPTDNENGVEAFWKLSCLIKDGANLIFHVDVFVDYHVCSCLCVWVVVNRQNFPAALGETTYQRSPKRSVSTQN